MRPHAIWYSFPFFSPPSTRRLLGCYLVVPLRGSYLPTHPTHPSPPPASPHLRPASVDFVTPLRQCPAAATAGTREVHSPVFVRSDSHGHCAGPQGVAVLCVACVCGGGGGGGRGVYGTVRTEGPRLGTRTFLPPPPLPLCAQDIIVIGGAYSGRDRSAKGTKHPSILKARTQHVPVVVVSRQCSAACIVGDGGWGWGGVA